MNNLSSISSRLPVYLIHGLCFLFAVAELTLLTVFSSLYGSAAHIVGFSVFGGSLVLFYFFRGLYSVHHVHGLERPVLRKLDSIMIILLIAATYMPIALILPSRGWAWSIFGVALGIALVSIALQLFLSLKDKWIVLFLYGAYFILDITAFNTVHAFLNEKAFFWFSMGALGYMAATAILFFRPRLAWLRYFKTHETLAVVFVAMGSFTHFWALLKHVLLS